MLISLRCVSSVFLILRIDRCRQHSTTSSSVFDITLVQGVERSRHPLLTPASFAEGVKRMWDAGLPADMCQYWHQVCHDMWSLQCSEAYRSYCSVPNAVRREWVSTSNRRGTNARPSQTVVDLSGSPAHAAPTTRDVDLIGDDSVVLLDLEGAERVESGRRPSAVTGGAAVEAPPLGACRTPAPGSLPTLSQTLSQMSQPRLSLFQAAPSPALGPVRKPQGPGTMKALPYPPAIAAQLGVASASATTSTLTSTTGTAVHQLVSTVQPTTVVTQAIPGVVPVSQVTSGPPDSVESLRPPTEARHSAHADSDVLPVPSMSHRQGLKRQRQPELEDDVELEVDVELEDVVVDVEDHVGGDPQPPSVPDHESRFDSGGCSGTGSVGVGAPSAAAVSVRARASGSRIQLAPRKQRRADRADPDVPTAAPTTAPMTAPNNREFDFESEDE